MNSASHAVPRAVPFIVLLGTVSLFADITYEGARSITGPYLQVLGATATAVGFLAGLGELVGYGLRLLSGFVTEKTGRYWAVTFTGYLVNLIAVPLMGVVPRWEWVAGLMLLERLGKAIRAPARDAMLSHATSQTGHGWGFGLHEFLDQLGAVSGPLFVAWALHSGKGYPTALQWLGLAAAAALFVLFGAFVLYPNPRELEVKTPELQSAGLSSKYWIYLSAAALIAAGYADFPLVAFHFQKTRVMDQSSVPLLYSLAMASDAIAALLFGRLYDRFGARVLAASTAVSALFAPLAFFGSPSMVLLGVVLWGIGMGAQESVLRAGIASLVPPSRRASAYGIFNLVYGVAWFVGSSLMGAFYDLSLAGLVSFAVLTQMAAVTILLRWRL